MTFKEKIITKATIWLFGLDIAYQVFMALRRAQREVK